MTKNERLKILDVIRLIEAESDSIAEAEGYSTPDNDEAVKILQSMLEKEVVK